MRISDWSSDVCSSDLEEVGVAAPPALFDGRVGLFGGLRGFDLFLANRAFRLAFGLEGFPDDRRLGIAARPAAIDAAAGSAVGLVQRSEEHTSELQSLMRNSYAVFCLKKKNTHYHNVTCLDVVKS